MSRTATGTKEAVVTERIVVGVDGSSGGRCALRWAVAEAAIRGASVEAVHAWREPHLGAVQNVPIFTDPQIFEHAARDTLEREIESVGQSSLVAPVEGFVVHGAAAGALVEAAKGADLLVVGSRGLGGFTGLLLGSVSHQVTHHAPCPVVVVRDDEPDDN